MKKLLLVRHAKSDWEDIKLSDFDRPLNKRGKKNVPEMAERLLKKGIVPQQIVSSPALRALTTAQLFAETLGIRKDRIQKEEKIYEATADTLLKIINNFDNKQDFIALFGHNPGITTLAEGLSDAYLSNIPTCGMVLIEFPFDDWAVISYGTGEQKMYDYPKNEE
jgi:phosphohistidine phosphatase